MEVIFRRMCACQLCCELGDRIWNTRQPSDIGEGVCAGQLEKEQVSAGVSTVGQQYLSMAWDLQASLEVEYCGSIQPFLLACMASTLPLCPTLAWQGQRSPRELDLTVVCASSAQEVLATGNGLAMQPCASTSTLFLQPCAAPSLFPGADLGQAAPMEALVALIGF